MNNNKNIIKSIKKYPNFSLAVFLNILYFLLGIIFLIKYGDEMYARQTYFFMAVSVVLSTIITFARDVLNKRHKIFDYLIYIIILFMLISFGFLYEIFKMNPSMW